MHNYAWNIKHFCISQQMYFVDVPIRMVPYNSSCQCSIKSSSVFDLIISVLTKYPVLNNYFDFTCRWEFIFSEVRLLNCTRKDPLWKVKNRSLFVACTGYFVNTLMIRSNTLLLLIEHWQELLYGKNNCLKHSTSYWIQRKFGLWLRSVLLVEETRVPGEKHRPAASNWQTLSHNVVSSTPRLSRIWTHKVGGDRH
jgi:hypothetical protein